jgi:hypothetical protein
LLRTHLGRFIGQIGDGSAGSVVARKLGSSLATFTAGWPRWIVLGWAVLALGAYLGHRHGRLRPAPSVDRRTVGGLVAGLLVLGFLGAGLNDSGLEIPAFVLYLAAPLLVPLVEPMPDPLPSSCPRLEVGVRGVDRS